jgi:threonine/homoserine/homoserine lactone efflux protein
MIELLIAGIILGIYAGLSPGPMLVLVVNQSIKHGFQEGAKMAFSPLISDLPIIVISLFFLTVISGFNIVLAIISIIGGLYLAYLAWEIFKNRKISVDISLEKPKSLSKGVVLNLLNPAPYIFWITIGGPLIIPEYTKNPFSILLFIIGFYAFLVGSKIAVAYATEKSRDFITGKTYLHILKILGIILTIFSIYYIYQGFQLL